MSVIQIISLIVSLLAAAVLLFFGIYGMIHKVSITSSGVAINHAGISEWVMIGLGVLLIIFSVWAFFSTHGSVNIESFFGAKKIETKSGEETVAVPPEGMKSAIQKFEEATGISVKGASTSVGSPSPRKSPVSSKKGKSKRR